MSKYLPPFNEREERLRMAAPDLLEALKAIRGALRQISKLSNINEATREIVISIGNRANQAIAKAEQTL